MNPALQWGWSEILQNKVAYLLEVLVWQNSKDASKKQPQHKPKPFVPEFMQLVSVKDMETHTTDDIRDILAKPRVE